MLRKVIVALAGAIGCVLLTVAPDATAQTAPPAFSAIDANGVDLSSGRLVLSEVPISVGPANGGLGREFFDAGSRDPLSGTIVRTQSGETDVYTVSLGGQSYVFTYAEGTFAAATGANGALLGVLPGNTGALFFVTRDGTRAEFSAPAQIFAPIASDAGQVLSIRKPNGETLSYTYVACGAGCSRLQAVTSNLGYMMKYEYVASGGAVGSATLKSVKAINLAYDYCDPVANGCTTSNTWMSVTLSGQTTGTGTYTVTDVLNRQTTYTLANNKITSISRPGGLTYQISYDGDGRVYTVTSPGSRIWTYTYEVLTPFNGLKTTVRDPLGHERYATTGAPGEPLASISDQMGQRIVYSNDPTTGRQAQVDNYPLGDVTAYAYDIRGNLQTTTRSGRGVTTTATSATYAPNCSGTYVNVSCNQPSTTTDERGNVTNYVYDPDHGGVTRITGPLNEQGVRPQIRFTYQPLYAWVRNSSNVLVQAPTPVYRLVSSSSCITGAGVDPTNPALLTTNCGAATNEIKTTYVYGVAGDTKNRQLTAVTVSYGDGSSAVTTTYDYTRFGDVSITDGPNPGAQDKSYARYDNARRLIDAIGVDPDGENTDRPANATHFEYFDDDRLKEEWTGTAASGSSTVIASQIRAIQYDSVTGLKTGEALKVGATTHALTSFQFDIAGRLECTTQRLTLSNVPASACAMNPSPSSDGPDRITHYVYDIADRVTGIETGIGTLEARTEAIAYPDADKIQGNADDLVRWVTDGKGNRTTYVFDGFGRTVEERFPSPTAPNTSSATDRNVYGYDAGSNVTSITHRNGTVDTISYDRFERPILRSLTDTHFTYDNLGRLKSAYRGSETPIVRAYDPVDRIVNESGPLGSVAYAYDSDASGRPRRRVTWPGTPSFWVDYVYDYSSALLEVREKSAISGAGLLSKFTYDAQNRRQSQLGGNTASESYGYTSTKPLGWLQSLTITPAGGDGMSTTLDYNAASQVRSKTTSNSQYVWNGATVTRDEAVNGLNQLTQAGANYVKYNAQGHLKSVCANANETGCQSVYNYTADDQLQTAAVTPPTGQSGTTVNSTMAYDALGRLFQVSANGTTTRFLYDGPDLIAEYDGSNILQRRYVHGQVPDEPLVWYEGSGTTDRRWMLANDLGSVVAVTGETGAIKLRPDGSKMILTYDDYGVPGASNGNVRFQYTGQAWLPEAALYHYKARAYSPSLGRFLQTDPIGYADGMNWYAYVGNDPINATDPTGYQSGQCANGEEGCSVVVDPVIVVGDRPSRTYLDWGDSTRLGRPDYSTMFGGTHARICDVGCLQVKARFNATRADYDARYGKWMLCAATCAVGAPELVAAGIGLAFDVFAARVASTRIAEELAAACNCFAAGTPVATSDGSKTIESIRVGDLVQSRDERTGNTALRPVTALIPGKERVIWEVQIEFRGQDGALSYDTIDTTEEHPFRADRDLWTPAANLRPGATLFTMNGSASVVRINKTKRVERTYNLEVADYHTYFVGESGAWVHNTCDPGKLGHLFGQAKHRLEPLLSKFGGDRQAAFAAVQRAANAELAAGRLATGPNGILPGAGNVLNVRGVLVQLSGGRVVNGSVAIGSFSSVIRLP